MALAHPDTSEAFTHVVILLTRRDSRHSLVGEVYATACRLTNAAKREKLDVEKKRFTIRTERWW